MHRCVRMARSRTETCSGERRVRLVAVTGLLGLRILESQPHHARSAGRHRACIPRLNPGGVVEPVQWGALGCDPATRPRLTPHHQTAPAAIINHSPGSKLAKTFQPLPNPHHTPCKLNRSRERSFRCQSNHDRNMPSRRGSTNTSRCLHLVPRAHGAVPILRR